MVDIYYRPAGYNVLKTVESLNVEVTCEDGTTGSKHKSCWIF